MNDVRTDESLLGFFTAKIWDHRTLLLICAKGDVRCSWYFQIFHYYKLVTKLLFNTQEELETHLRTVNAFVDMPKT